MQIFNNLLNMLGINDAVAQAATTAAGAHPAQQGGLMSLLPTLLLFVVVFYFLLIRPQAKRAKEQRSLMEGLAKEDEVVTSGGIVGKIVDVQDNFLTLQIAKDVEISCQKSAVAMVLPKGTMKAV